MLEKFDENKKTTASGWFLFTVLKTLKSGFVIHSTKGEAMNQVQRGLFPADTPMPCLPSDIRAGEGFLPDNFREEVAAIIVSFSQQANQWVGISTAHLKEKFSMGTFIKSFQQLSAGIDELVQKEMLRLSVDGEGEHSLTVVSPTPTLISRILQKQRVILAN